MTASPTDVSSLEVGGAMQEQSKRLFLASLKYNRIPVRYCVNV